MVSGHLSSKGNVAGDISLKKNDGFDEKGLLCFSRRATCSIKMADFDGSKLSVETSNISQMIIQTLLALANLSLRGSKF